MNDLFFSQKISERNKKFQERKLAYAERCLGVEVFAENRVFIQFSSNNYLGVAQSPLLRERAIAFIERYGVGSGASRLAGGSYSYHAEGEKKLAQALGYEASLLFPSGFQANVGLLSAIADRETTIFADRACHNSLWQGALLSRAKIIRYRHRDVSHLERLLQKASAVSRKAIVAESLFSMDGDSSDLEALINLAKRYGCLLCIDDAHALGVCGEKGMGAGAFKKGIDFLTGSFGKAGGCAGGYIACSLTARDYLAQFCSSFIYTTALSAATVGAIEASVSLIPSLQEERARLWRYSAFFQDALVKRGFRTSQEPSPIVPLFLGDEAKALSLAAWLKRKGFLAAAIRPPTVPAGESRIRFSLSALHREEHLRGVLDALDEWRAQ